MNLRGVSYATERLPHYPDTTAAHIAMENSAIVGRTPLTKKLILTLLLLLQVCFITCLWLLQLGGNNSGVGDMTNSIANGVRKTSALVHRGSPSGPHSMIGVNFIERKIASSRVITPTAAHKDVNNFRKDFYLKTQRLNLTMMEKLGSEELWCFREGSINITNFFINAIENDASTWEEELQCRCRAGWHGKDCGQPEIMWRALMNAKFTLKLQDPRKAHARRLVCLLEGNFFNLDLLDLQINLIANVVDFFVIYVRQQRKELLTLERKLRETLNTGNFLLFQCNQSPLGIDVTNCSAAQAYAYFRKQLQLRSLTLQEIKPNDLFLYADDRGLISHTSLQFLKYYAKNLPVMTFRLKYVVYGFYWQHPAQTHLTGAISSFVHLDDPQRGAGNPAAMQRRILTSSGDGRPFLIGDLNHFGGWFCKYCQQPDEIIAELLAESSSLNHVHFPNVTRNQNIDVAYLQKLIASGKYLDAKTQLLRNRRYTDKYYAPLYAEANSWKFGNLLVNLYESFDDDLEDEVEAY